MVNLYRLLIDKDVTMMEINPMVETEDGEGKKLTATYSLSTSSLQ